MVGNYSGEEKRTQESMAAFAAAEEQKARQNRTPAMTHDVRELVGKLRYMAATLDTDGHREFEDIASRAADTIERLINSRLAQPDAVEVLKTVRDYIADQDVAGAVVAPHGEAPRGDHPSLLSYVDAAIARAPEPVRNPYKLPSEEDVVRELLDGDCNPMIEEDRQYWFGRARAVLALIGGKKGEG